MPRNSAAYDEDFYAWTQEQAALLRSRQFSQVDIENVAEELESMGRSDKRQIDSRLEMLLTHLLKWQVQVLLRSPGWAGTIREQRRRIDVAEGVPHANFPRGDHDHERPDADRHADRGGGVADEAEQVDDGTGTLRADGGGGEQQGEGDGDEHRAGDELAHGGSGREDGEKIVA